jgi:hypothetical protein
MLLLLAESGAGVGGLKKTWLALEGPALGCRLDASSEVGAGDMDPHSMLRRSGGLAICSANHSDWALLSTATFWPCKSGTTPWETQKNRSCWKPCRVCTNKCFTKNMTSANKYQTKVKTHNVAQLGICHQPSLVPLSYLSSTSHLHQHVIHNLIHCQNLVVLHLWLLWHGFIGHFDSLAFTNCWHPIPVLYSPPPILVDSDRTTRSPRTVLGQS